MGKEKPLLDRINEHKYVSFEPIPLRLLFPVAHSIDK